MNSFQLLNACEYNKLDQVSELLQKFDSSGILHEIIDLQDNHGRTAIMWATINKNLKMVQLILHHNSNCNINKPDNAGMRPLHKAIQLNCCDIILLLIQHQADVNAVNKYGWTVLMEGTEKGSFEGVSMLLNHSFDCNINALDRIGSTALFRAVFRGFDNIAILLIEKGCDVDTISFRDMKTPLILACEKNRYEICKALLRSGVNINHKDFQGLSALSIASSYGFTPIVNLLLQYSADPNALDIHNRTPLIDASYNGHFETVVTLLEYKAEVNIQNDNGNTALIGAAINGHFSIVKVLLQNEANIHLCDSQGKSILIWLAIAGHIDIMEYLLHEYKEIVNINQVDIGGTSALIRAAENGFEDVVQVLLHFGADINLTNNYNQTALLWACQNKHYRVVELLLQSGAEVNIQCKLTFMTPLLLLLQDFIENNQDQLNIVIKILLLGANTGLKNIDGHDAFTICSNEEVIFVVKNSLWLRRGSIVTLYDVINQQLDINSKDSKLSLHPLLQSQDFIYSLCAFL